MIEQLVRGFMPARIAALLDFTRLERVNAKFHAARSDRRESDVIWRVPTLAGEMVHIYLMLEFQSTPERFMPVRVQVYSGLLRRLFARRFGALPAGAERLIEDATAEQLDDYMYRLMDARSPDDVFRAWMTGSSPRLSGTMIADQPQADAQDTSSSHYRHART
ncbi:Rpn family recombination-promoting nuclease/putative transposase [Skermanella sp. TT6]|uniref:Rpn family recombination-promoting nuclease/putative transposase n=1 Tax=Skermanella cutis TaxID=2775420 RepID=A0ABX7B985_9PROT|nr:Rpn family recombination-promoting nuclease/putative transposase [Skermanella sp. TT6]